MQDHLKLCLVDRVDRLRAKLLPVSRAVGAVLLAVELAVDIRDTKESTSLVLDLVDSHDSERRVRGLGVAPADVVDRAVSARLVGPVGLGAIVQEPATARGFASVHNINRDTVVASSIGVRQLAR